jgi:hypothetical protein
LKFFLEFILRTTFIITSSDFQNSEVKGSEGKGREGKGSKLRRGCEVGVSVVKWNEGKVKVKCGCISS